MILGDLRGGVGREIPYRVGVCGGEPEEERTVGEIPGVWRKDLKNWRGRS